MIIYGNILKIKDGQQLTGFAYDGKNLKTGYVYSLLLMDDPFYGNVIPITPEGLEKALINFNLEIDYIDVEYSKDDLEPAKRYLKAQYPITYNWTNTDHNIYECMPEIEELEEYSISEIFQKYYSYLNPAEYFSDWDNEYAFYDPIEYRMILELQMILNGNYEGGDEETALYNVEYIEECFKDHYFNPECCRLIDNLYIDSIENYIDEDKLKELDEKYKPEYLK